MNPRPATVLLSALVILGCSSSGGYLGDRGNDLTDIIDVKYGADWQSFGFGGKLEATNYLGVGAGVGHYDRVTETFGRDTVRRPMGFMHTIVYGYDSSGSIGAPKQDAEMHTFALNVTDRDRPKVVDRFRFGGELLLANITGGLYVNAGQLLDFVVGLTTLDIAGDDANHDSGAALAERDDGGANAEYAGYAGYDADDAERDGNADGNDGWGWDDAQTRSASNGRAARASNRGARWNGGDNDAYGNGNRNNTNAWGNDGNAYGSNAADAYGRNGNPASSGGAGYRNGRGDEASNAPRYDLRPVDGAFGNPNADGWQQNDGWQNDGPQNGSAAPNGSNAWSPNAPGTAPAANGAGMTPAQQREAAIRRWAQRHGVAAPPSATNAPMRRPDGTILYEIRPVTRQPSLREQRATNRVNEE